MSDDRALGNSLRMDFDNFILFIFESFDPSLGILSNGNFPISFDFRQVVAKHSIEISVRKIIFLIKL